MAAVGRDELGIALYDEVAERRTGLDPDVEAYENRWNTMSPGERRALQGAADDATVDLLDAYAETVAEYNRLGEELYGDDPDRDRVVEALLPEEMVWTDSEDVYLAAPGDAGEAILFSSWLQRWHDRILTADGYERLERKLDQAGFAGHDTETEDALYQAWEDAGIDWGLHLWSLLHLPELDVRGKLERRRALSDDIATYATELEERLDPKGGVFSDDSPEGFLGRVRDALDR